MSPFLGELKRRHVLRVAVAYLAAAWFVVQAGDIVVDAFELPRAVMRGVFLLLILGLVPVLVVSWIYELTPQGLKRQSDVTTSELGSQRTAGWLNRIVIGLLIAVVGLLLLDKFVLRHDSGQRSGVAVQAVAGGATAGTDVAARVPDRPSIAVLPFESLSASPESGYFADGMTDDIITELSKLSGIFVIARNSSQTYKGKAVKVQQVASDLGVRYVLEGSVRREGDTVRINAQLVDAVGGQHLWAERYDGALQDVFALQDKVIAQIVAALAISLTHDQQRSAERVETQIPEAYDALLQGWA
jgi:TolB-like protein